MFNASALQLAGGFDPERWNLILEDHEIVHRVLKRGTMAYSPYFWCAPSPRPRNRQSTRWSLFERAMYHIAASHAGDWFFEDFLGPRLARRKLSSQRLREDVETMSNSLPRPIAA